MRPLLAALVTAAALGARVGAQAVPDHLKCYKMVDPAPKASYTAELGGLVAEPGCVIRVPAKAVCVPATKSAVTPAPPGGGGAGAPNVFACYKVKCPKVALPTIQLDDQFGSRIVTPKRAKLLCAPAAPSTTTTTTTSSSTTSTLQSCGAFTFECSGSCPPDAVCTTQDLATCVCISSGSPCGQTFPVCNGQCPAGEECMTVAGSPLPSCQCAPTGTVLCGNAAFPSCGGVCPVGQACLPFFQPPSSGGIGACGCATEGLECGNVSCGGTCPPGFACAVVPPGGSSCLCAPIPCTGGSSYPVCDGVCSGGFTCQPVDTGSFQGCVCAP